MDGTKSDSVLTSILKSHDKLNVNDIQYAISIISNMNLSDVELSRFCLQAYKLTNTGRFSLTYNEDLDYHIKNRVPSRIQKLVKGARSREAWPELYNNPLLTRKQVIIIDDMNNIEYQTVLKGINTNKMLVRSCVDQDTKETISVSDDVYYNNIYTKCYDQICVAEAKQRGKIVSLSNPNIPKVAYISDPSSNMTKECFDLMTLISRFANNNYLNPTSNQQFSATTIGNILSKYDKEIKMYKKHLELMNNVKI